MNPTVEQQTESMLASGQQKTAELKAQLRSVQEQIDQIRGIQQRNKEGLVQQKATALEELEKTKALAEGLTTPTAQPSTNLNLNLTTTIAVSLISLSIGLLLGLWIS